MTLHDNQVVEPQHVLNPGPDLKDYLLSRDRGRRQPNPHVRYLGLVNLITLAFNVHESDGMNRSRISRL